MDSFRLNFFYDYPEVYDRKTPDGSRFFFFFFFLRMGFLMGLSYFVIMRLLLYFILYNIE